jgi:hypothetical protein
MYRENESAPFVHYRFTFLHVLRTNLLIIIFFKKFKLKIYCDTFKVYALHKSLQLKQCQMSLTRKQQAHTHC